MGHLCRFCQRPLSRRYNRDHHEKQGCHKRLEQEEMTIQCTTGNPSAASFLEGQTDKEYQNYQSQEDEEHEEYDEDDDDIFDDESEFNEDEGVSNEDNESATTEDENDDTDPWDKLRQEAIIDLNTSREEQVDQYIMQNLSKEEAEFQVSTLLLSAYRKKLLILYLQYLKWYRVLKTDPVHKKVMTTLRGFMKEDEMDFVEAAEATINKRKYLLNRLFKYEDLFKESLSENDDDDETPYMGRKRKYHEIQ